MQLDPFYLKSPPELACNLNRDAELFPSVQLKDIRSEIRLFLLTDRLKTCEQHVSNCPVNYSIAS